MNTGICHMMNYHLSISGPSKPKLSFVGQDTIAKITCSCQQSQLASQEVYVTWQPPQEGVGSIKAHHHINYETPKVAGKLFSRNSSKK